MREGRLKMKVILSNSNLADSDALFCWYRFVVCFTKLTRPSLEKRVLLSEAYRHFSKARNIVF